MTATTPATSAARELLHTFYRLVDAGDIDGLAALFSDDARYIRPGYSELHGRAVIERFYRHDRVISTGRHTLDTIAADGDRLAVCGSFQGVLRDGAPVRHRFAEFFHLDPCGRIDHRETFFAVAHV
ncbi:MAG: nuclear transport factor 2 family protein [Frankiaceae bacterium]